MVLIYEISLCDLIMVCQYNIVYNKYMFYFAEPKFTINTNNGSVNTNFAIGQSFSINCNVKLLLPIDKLSAAWMHNETNNYEAVLTETELEYKVAPYQVNSATWSNAGSYRCVVSEGIPGQNVWLSIDTTEEGSNQQAQYTWNSDKIVIDISGMLSNFLKRVKAVAKRLFIFIHIST